MLDTVKAVIAPIRTQFATLPKVPTLYVNERADTAVLPHGWIYNEDESLYEVYMGMNQDVVVFHLWAESRTQLQGMEDAVQFLDDYRAATTGNAVAAHYILSSKPPIPEGAGIWHTTIRYIVVYADKRKLG